MKLTAKQIDKQNVSISHGFVTNGHWLVSYPWLACRVPFLPMEAEHGPAAFQAKFPNVTVLGEGGPSEESMRRILEPGSVKYDRTSVLIETGHGATARMARIYANGTDVVAVNEQYLPLLDDPATLHGDTNKPLVALDGAGEPIAAVMPMIVETAELGRIGRVLAAESDGSSPADEYRD